MALIDEDYLRISLRSEAFRISFEEPFRAVFALALLGAVSWSVSQGISNYVVLGLAIPLATGLMSAISIEVLRRRYLFYISPEGLSCLQLLGISADDSVEFDANCPTLRPVRSELPENHCRRFE